MDSPNVKIDLRQPFAASLAAAALTVLLHGSVQAQQTRGVVELFTSQGCSSCPPADELMGVLGRDPSLVVITVPIDYWDYLGWKDTMAKPRHTQRQRGYAKMRGDRDVYTPQAVINGIAHVQGSDKTAIERMLAETKQREHVLSTPVKLKVVGDKLQVDVERQAAAFPAEIWLCALTRQVQVQIGRGENSGKTVDYHNVVRRWTKLGDLNGAARVFSIPLSDLRADGADSAAVLVQAGSIERPGSIFGAAIASLR